MLGQSITHQQPAPTPTVIDLEAPPVPITQAVPTAPLVPGPIPRVIPPPVRPGLFPPESIAQHPQVWFVAQQFAAAPTLGDDIAHQQFVLAPTLNEEIGPTMMANNAGWFQPGSRRPVTPPKQPRGPPPPHLLKPPGTTAVPRPPGVPRATASTVDAPPSNFEVEVLGDPVPAHAASQFPIQVGSQDPVTVVLKVTTAPPPLPAQDDQVWSTHPTPWTWSQNHREWKGWKDDDDQWWDADRASTQWKYHEKEWHGDRQAWHADAEHGEADAAPWKWRNDEKHGGTAWQEAETEPWKWSQDDEHWQGGKAWKWSQDDEHWQGGKAWQEAETEPWKWSKDGGHWHGVKAWQEAETEPWKWSKDDEHWHGVKPWQEADSAGRSRSKDDREWTWRTHESKGTKDEQPWDNAEAFCKEEPSYEESGTAVKEEPSDDESPHQGPKAIRRGLLCLKRERPGDFD